MKSDINTPFISSKNGKLIRFIASKMNLLLKEIRFNNYPLAIKLTASDVNFN